MSCFISFIESAKQTTGINDNKILALAAGTTLIACSLGARSLLAGAGFVCKGVASHTSNEEYVNHLGERLIHISQANLTRNVKIVSNITVVVASGGSTANDFVNLPQPTIFENIANTVYTFFAGP